MNENDRARATDDPRIEWLIVGSVGIATAIALALAGLLVITYLCENL